MSARKVVGIGMAVLFVVGYIWVREEFRTFAEPSKSSKINKIQKNDKIKCNRCDGRGTIAKYASNTCTSFTHFPMTNCGMDNHGAKCFSVGVKTCPCCKGTGKW